MKTFQSRALLAGILGFSGWVLVGCGGDTISGSCPDSPATISPPESLASIIDPLMASKMKAEGLVGASVAVAKNGTILYTRGYGYADLHACAPVRPETVFQIGSVTKQFSAAAVLQLYHAGKLNIDDPVASYLPRYAFDRRITLRMLLNQTSGLRDYLQFGYAPTWLNGVSERTVLTEIARTDLLFTPGSYHAYSNSNYFVLGSIIEAVTAETYAEYMTRHVFQPLGLNHTTYSRPADAASPYERGPKHGIVPDPSLYFAAGALWSNVEDLAKWDAALVEGKVIPPSLFAVMTTPSGVSVYPSGGASLYAMGLVVGTEAGHPWAWHNGGTLAYTAFNGILLDDGLSVIVLTNVRIWHGTVLLDLGEQLMQGICKSAATAGNC